MLKYFHISEVELMMGDAMIHLQTATLYPGIVFGTCFFLNFFIWGQHSSGAVSAE